MLRSRLDRAARLAREVEPCVPGVTLEEAARRVGVSPKRIVKLSCNENPLGPSPRVHGRTVVAVPLDLRKLEAPPAHDGRAPTAWGLPR